MPPHHAKAMRGGFPLVTAQRMKLGWDCWRSESSMAARALMKAEGWVVRSKAARRVARSREERLSSWGEEGRR